MPKDFEQEAYDNTYQYLDNFVAAGIRELSDPFRPGEGSRLKKEATKYFDLHTLNVFLNLPDYFSKITERYGALAHNYIIQVLRKNPHPEKATRPVARVLLDACRIDAQLRNDLKSKQLVPLFEQILAQKEVETKEFVGGAWKGWIGFVIVIGFLLFFAIFGDLPAKFQKKSDYQKSVERYNYYRNKKPQTTPRNQPRTEVGNLQGAWRADLFLHKARIYRTFHLYTPQIGKSVYQFVTEQGEEQARLTAWFHWEVDNSRRESQFDLLKTRHRGDILIEGDTSIMSPIYRDVFENVQSRMEHELFEEVVKFSDDDYFLLANKRYYRETTYESANLPEEATAGIQKMQQFEQKLRAMRQQLINTFEKDSLMTRSFRFDISLMDDVLYVNDNQKIGFIKMVDSISHFQPWKWTKGKNYEMQGVFKNVTYMKNDTVRTGDLEMLYYARRGFRFRETGELPKEEMEKLE